MPDQLNLSLWVRQFNHENMLRHFEELLRVFPFSRLRPGIGSLRIGAIDYGEPPLFDQAFPEAPDAGELIEICQEFEHPDCVFSADGWWELWRYEKDWQLKPAPVTLACFGPEFDNEIQDHLRLTLGAETDFLPQPGAPQAAQKVQSNLAGIVRLAREIGNTLPLERRSLWSDSGENFAERLDDVLAD